MRLSNSEMLFNSLSTKYDYYGTTFYNTTRESALVNDDGDMIVLRICRVYRKHNPEITNLSSTWRVYTPFKQEYEFSLFGLEADGQDELFVATGGEVVNGSLWFFCNGQHYKYLTSDEYEYCTEYQSINTNEWMELIK